MSMVIENIQFKKVFKSLCYVINTMFEAIMYIKTILRYLLMTVIWFENICDFYFCQSHKYKLLSMFQQTKILN